MAALGLAGGASGQFSTGFEEPDYEGSADGVILTGQDEWYLPAGIDAFVFTYADNAVGFPANPTGGDQFVGGISLGGSSFARAERSVDTTAGSSWMYCHDFAGTYDGNLPATLNLASFSLQPSPTSKHFIQLNNFMDVNDPSAGWKAEYNVFNAANGALVNQSPGAEWTNLTVNSWYRICTSVDFSTNLVTEVSITDLSTGDTFTANPVGWYMQGGEDPNAFPDPTGVRFFVGGTTAGNIAGFDNLDVTMIDEEPDCYADLNDDGDLDLFDFLTFTNLFNANDPMADCDESGGLDLFDFLCFTNAFNAGC